MDPTPEAEWVSVAEAAEAAGVSTSTIRYWYRHGSIPTQRADGNGGRYLVPLDAVMARANRLGEEDELEDAELDMDAVYWSAEAEKARKEVADVRNQLVDANSRVAALEERVRELESELDSLEIIEDDEALVDLAEEGDEEELDFEPAPFVADVPGPTQGYRGPLRPQDPRGELRFEDELEERLALPAAALEAPPAIELDGPDVVVANPSSPEPEPAFVVDAAVFEDDVLPAPEKGKRKK